MVKNLVWILKEELRIRGLWRHLKKNRYDETEIVIQNGAKLLIYWKNETIGSGPTLTLAVKRREIVRFDCFGKGDGHYHIFPEADKRIDLDGENIKEQIEESITMISKNHQAYLQDHRISEVQSFELDPVRLTESLELARVQLLNIVKEKFS